MFKVAFEHEAEKEFLSFQKSVQIQIATKIRELQKGHFLGDKALQGRHKGKFRKHAGDYRIIYLKEGELLVITIIRVAHRKEVYD